MTTIKLVAVGLYLAVLIGIGVVASRRMKDVRDYFAAGKGLGFWAVAFSARLGSLEARRLERCANRRAPADEERTSPMNTGTRLLAATLALAAAACAPEEPGEVETASSVEAPRLRQVIDPELMIRMLLIGYCYAIRSERRLCEEVRYNLA